MTSQPQPADVGVGLRPTLQLFRSLKKTAIVLMLWFRLDKPVGESEIARILDIHPETTRIYLRSLARLGLVTRTHRFNGWALTTGGRQMILGEGKDPWPVLDAGKTKTSAENPRSISQSPTPSAENPRSPPLAAASLSLSFKQKKRNTAAAAIAGASVKISPSRYSRLIRSQPSNPTHPFMSRSSLAT
jgi:hypothetical protein